ncbi:Kinase, NEK [Giardia lamblia P15]|uniref:non-specific serine/threonine protein kinase n=1 Tax=Giardia intestinalis (strain P15) TaxID=658858 RepID=E1F901_GIAIA|nr:Kinase, NEK [Giardia lamblia P15]
MDRYDKTLEDLLTEHKRRRLPVSLELVLSIMRQVAAALAYLHGVSGVDADGLVHCDLRPANVLVSADGEYFVITGLSLCRDALGSGSPLLEMAAYMAPEALLRSEASPASDMWSLGAILYELATLRRPDFLKGREPAEVFVDGWRPDLSAVADGFIKGILERIFVLEPEGRLTAGELYKTLTAAAIPVSELGHRHKVLEEKYNSLEIAVSNNNDRVALLEEDAKAKSTKIDALKDQGKEHLTMIKALENRFTQSSSETNTSGS